MLTQEQRIRIYESFRETNGEEVAMSLAEGFEDLATKEDLRDVASKLEAKLEAKIDAQLWKLASLVVLLFGLGISARIFG